MFGKEDFIAVWVMSIILIFVKAVAFWVLWNWLIVYMFKLPEITVWQSIGGWFLYAVVTLKLNIKK